MNVLYRACSMVAIAGLVCFAANAQVPDSTDGIAYVIFFGNTNYPLRKATAAEETAARQVQQTVGAKFMMWFKLDGKTYVSQDQKTMNRLHTLYEAKAWQPLAESNVEAIRQENVAFFAANSPSVLERSTAEFRQLAESVRQMASLPITKDQDLSDLQKRVRAMTNLVLEMQRQVERRDNGIKTLLSAERQVQELGTERQILSEALASGKAQAVP